MDWSNTVICFLATSPQQIWFWWLYWYTRLAWPGAAGLALLAWPGAAGLALLAWPGAAGLALLAWPGAAGLPLLAWPGAAGLALLAWPGTAGLARVAMLVCTLPGTAHLAWQDMITYCHMVRQLALFFQGVGVSVDKFKQILSSLSLF